MTQDSRAYEQSRSCYHLNGPKSALPEVSRVHTRTSLDQAKSVELTAFACAFPRLIWATWATRWPEFQAVRSRASTNQTIFGTDEILARNRPRGSEIVDAVFQSEKSIRGEPVESCKLRYFNSFEFFDHTGSAPAITFRTSERHATSGTGQKQGRDGQTHNRYVPPRQNQLGVYQAFTKAAPMFGHFVFGYFVDLPRGPT